MPGQYSIPADNPFAGATPGADEIYAYGLRNPWRFSFDRLTGDLTIGDVGYNSWEEIDFMPNGTGTGRQLRLELLRGQPPTLADAGRLHAAAENHTPPVLEYPHPGHRGRRGHRGLRDPRRSAAVTARSLHLRRHLRRLRRRVRTAQLFAGGSSGDSGLGVIATNVVSFGEDACAHIYVAAIGGTVYRLEPTSGPFPCKPTDSARCSSPACRPARAAGDHRRHGRQRRAHGTPGQDVIVGLGGNDTLSGLAGNDLICGGDGQGHAQGGRRKGPAERPEGQRQALRPKGQRQAQRQGGQRHAQGRSRQGHPQGRGWQGQAGPVAPSPKRCFPCER